MVEHHDWCNLRKVIAQTINLYNHNVIIHECYHRYWNISRQISWALPSNHLVLCCTLLLLLSIIPRIRVYSSALALFIGWSQYYSFSFRISLSNEYSYLISFRIDWFYLLAVQGTLKSILQQHSLKASILPCSACLIVQMSHLCMATRKTIALTIWAFISKVMSVFYNALSKLVCSSPWDCKESDTTGQLNNNNSSNNNN